jgi:DNA uptake protein ComE-like DNA-binding protein
MKRFRRRHRVEDVEMTAVTRDIPGVVAAWTGGTTAREQEVADGPSEPPEALEAPEQEVLEDPGEPLEAPEEEVAGRDSEPPEAPEAAARNRVSLSSATFEDLRALGLSVTQATRLLIRREKQGGFESVDDLDELPGFPSSLRAELKSRVEV